jgi:hypothetical protein
VTNPTSTQPQTNNIHAVTTTSAGVVIGGSVTGILPAIVEQIGTLDPRVVFPFSPKNSSFLSLQVTFSLSNMFPIGGQLLLTLSGAGLSIDGNQDVTFLSASPGATGVVSMNTNLVLSFRIVSGTLSPGVISFLTYGVRTPYQAQAELFGLFGAIVSSSNFVVSAFVNASMSTVYPWLGLRMPSLRLQPSIRGHVGSSLEISFMAERSFARAALLVISMPGLCVQFNPTKIVKIVYTAAAQFYDSFEASVTISAGSIRINLLHQSMPSVPGQLFSIVVDNVSCPSSSQSTIQNVFATLYDHNSDIIGQSNSGVFEPVAETLGISMPSISLSSQMPGASNVTVFIKIMPASVPVSPSRLVISLPGQGFLLSSNKVVFTSPSNGVLAQASVLPDSNHKTSSFSVLEIRILSGSFVPRQLLDLYIPGSFSIANYSQKSSDSVSAAWLDSNNSICAASVSGQFPEIFPFFPHSSTKYGSALKFVASPQVHGFAWDTEVFFAVKASMSKVSFSQQKFSDHVVLSVSPMFVGSDQLSVFHLQQGGVVMTVLACPSLFDFPDENLCLSLFIQRNASFEFKPQLNPVLISELSVLFVQWQGYVKPPRHELLTFEIQAVGRIRFWLDEIMQLDTRSIDFNNMVTFSFNVTSMHSVLFVRMECVGQYSQVVAAVFWSSKQMTRQV